MKKIQVIMTMVKITPGTHRFEEPKPAAGKRNRIGNVYLTKEGVAELGNPQKVRVTVEPIE